MKTLRVIASLSPLDGGPSFGAASISEEINKSGGDDVILTTDAHGPTTADPRTFFETTHTHLNIHSSRVRGIKRLKIAPAFPLLLRRSLKNASSVHIHGFYGWLPYVTGMMSLAYKRRYVIQPHGTFEPYQARQSRVAKRFFMALGGSLILSRASAVIFATETERDAAFALKPVPNPRVISLGVDASLLDIPLRISTDSEAPTLLFLARIAPKKRIDLAIQAYGRIWQRIPGARLIIAGDGDLTLLHRALDLLPAGAISNVDYRGFVEGEAKKAAFAESDVYILPSENENFGVSVAEALAAGVPQVVSKHVALAPLIESASSGVVVQDLTPQAVERAVLRLLDPAMGATARQKSRALAIENSVGHEPLKKRSAFMAITFESGRRNNA